MLLRVPPFRGAQVAAGVVVLTTLALLLELRMSWSPAGHLLATGGLAVLVWALLVATPPADGRARPWLAALCLSGVTLLAVATGHVCDLLGADGFLGRGSSGAVTVTAFVTCAAATWCVRARGAASCALVAGTTGTIGLVAAAQWAADPSLTAIRWLLTVAAFVLLVLALANRDRRHLAAAQYANAGGLAVAAIGSPVLLDLVDAALPIGLPSAGLGTGWELLLMAAGFGLLAYGAVDGERGPVVVGLLDLALFVGAAAHTDGIWGWPVVLLLGGLAFIAIGLRPTTPAPPEPGIDLEPLPPVEVRPLR